MQNYVIETMGLRGQMWLRAQNSKTSSGTKKKHLIETDLHVLNG